jgi:hypothetical protein
MVAAAVPTASTRVLWSERRNVSSPRTLLQLASVQGSAMWKKPKSFMKVPRVEKSTGTPSTRKTTPRSQARAGPRQRPSGCTRLWNWPVTVV